ncbi:MAG: LacI family DNA-binding transcriptional regulator [Paracoccaceae bacterium]
MNRKVRQSEIAELSGVSISTVSRVLNGVPGISDDVRAEVVRAAASLGYLAQAPSKRTDLAKAVLLISPLTFLAGQTGQFHIDILEGISRAARDAKVALTCVPLGDAAEMDAALAGQDGLLLLSVDAPDVVTLADARSLPVCLVNTELFGDTHDVTVPDNRGGAAKAARLLLELGHRDLIYIAHSARDTIKSRTDGFSDAVTAGLGQSAAPRVVRLDYAQPIADFEAALRKLLSEKPFTAVGCSNDITALAAVQALNRMGLSVPADVSVVGFDDLPMAALANPQLTTVRIDRQALGEAAFRRLLDRIAAPAMPPIHQMVLTQLVVRSSTSQVATDNK